MSDAIKDRIGIALWAAVVAYDQARVASHGGVFDRDQMSERNMFTIRPMIAAAVAEFLRELPEGDAVFPHIGGIGKAMSLDALAAAVERPAKDAADG